MMKHQADAQVKRLQKGGHSAWAERAVPSAKNLNGWAVIVKVGDVEKLLIDEIAVDVFLAGKDPSTPVKSPKRRKAAAKRTTKTTEAAMESKDEKKKRLRKQAAQRSRDRTKKIADGAADPPPGRGPK
jgi:hypothetical protein